MYEALALGEGAAVAIVGASGVTRLAYGLAREGAERGLAVVLTSTAGLPGRPGEELRIVEAAAEDACRSIAASIQPGRAVIATPGSDREAHWERYPERVVELIAADVQPGLLIVKCDGSRGRPLKAPAAHEPPIPGIATDVVVCAGLGALGLPLSAETAHRHERVTELAACPDGDRITADLIVKVLSHNEGGRKHVPPAARISTLLDGPETSDHERLGCYIGERLVYGGFHRAVVAVTDPWLEIRALVQ